jgi:4-alpha-glucanotransferase
MLRSSLFHSGLRENGLPQLSYRQIIDRLAESYGIEPEYQDNWSRVHRTSLETKQKVLMAMGVDVDTEVHAKKAWYARGEGQWSRMSESTIVAKLSSLPEGLVFQIPVEDQGVSDDPTGQDLEGSLDVMDEQGAVRRFSFTAKDLSFCGEMRRGDAAYQRWRLPFPPLEALGYYRFRLSVHRGGQRRSETILVAICPDKAYVPPDLQGGGRAAGIAISLYGVRSEKNWGVGDFGDLKQIVRWVAQDLHGSVVGLNPLHALYNRKPFNISPYLPMSRFYRNFIYLDIPAMTDYRDSPEAQDLVRALETQGLLSELRASESIQYERVAALKHQVLRHVFRTFLKNQWKEEAGKTDRKKNFEAYIEREGLLLDNFATYCALDGAMRSGNPQMWTWLQWPQEYHRPDSSAVRRFQQEHWEEVLFYKYVQWQLETQLEEVQGYAKTWGTWIGLYHDLALACDRCSADFWAYQDSFISGLRVGAPPDAFSPQGQDWGFPLTNMERLRQTGYDLFIKEIQKNAAFAGALRIDHVMRFFHLYCIPEGDPPWKGAYVSQPFEDLLNLVALESVRGQVLIIGEDLGTVPPYVRDRLSETNILSYRLLYFERDGRRRHILPQDYPELALVTVGTHDLPTLAGFWTHRDIAVRKEVGLLDSQQAAVAATSEREADKRTLLVALQELSLLPKDTGPEAYPEIMGDLHDAVVGFLASTPAKLFLLSQEDLFKETEQQNLPGTTVEYPNWSLKARYSVEQLGTDPRARGFCVMFRNWIDRTGRCKSAA